MSKELTTTSQQPFNHPSLNTLTLEDWQSFKDTYLKGRTDSEAKVFMAACNRLGLDPIAKQIYPVGRWDSKLGKEVMAVQTSIDGYRVVANRSLEYAGQIGPHWCGDDGVWKDVWLDKTPPRAARVGVLRKGFAEPMYAVALWEAYCQTTKDGSPTQFWKKMGSLMLAKCAEALALRKAFPNDLSGVYTAEEMMQARAADDSALPAEAPPAMAPASGTGMASLKKIVGGTDTTVKVEPKPEPVAEVVGEVVDGPPPKAKALKEQAIETFQEELAPIPKEVIIAQMTAATGDRATGIQMIKDFLQKNHPGKTWDALTPSEQHHITNLIKEESK